VRSNLFIRIHELPDAFLVRCADLEKRNGLIQAEPGKFFITSHYSGCLAVLVRLSQVDLDEMTGLVTESWRLSAPKRLLAATPRSTHLHHDGRNARAVLPARTTDERAQVAAEERGARQRRGTDMDDSWTPKKEMTRSSGFSEVALRNVTPSSPGCSGSSASRLYMRGPPDARSSPPR